MIYLLIMSIIVGFVFFHQFILFFAKPAIIFYRKSKSSKVWETHKVAFFVFFFLPSACDIFIMQKVNQYKIFYIVNFLLTIYFLVLHFKKYVTYII